MTTSYLVSICNEGKIVWEDLIIANNTIDAQDQALNKANAKSVIGKQFYTSVDIEIVPEYQNCWNNYFVAN
jgi:hypothetical protein